jgi:uncharacterized glyoxalase superfamily protein PhnB
MKLTGICIITENVRKMAEFYSKVLKVEAEMNDVHSFVKTEHTGLALYSKHAAERDMGFDFSKYWGSGNICLEFPVEDVDSEYERLKKLDVEFVATPKTHSWGNRAMQFRDFDGNIITFASWVGE